MRRYFYSAPPLLKKWLENQFQLTRLQDQYFRDALLTSVKLSLQSSNPKYNLPPEKLHQLRQTILDMTMTQQEKYSNNMHLQMIYKHLECLHRNSRGKSMLVKGAKTNIKDLVDPDKFPVWDLTRSKEVFYSRWDEIEGKLRYDHGHQLIIGDSLVEHPSGNRGVFAVLKQGKDRIYPGDFIGLVPGVVYESYNSYQRLKLKRIKSYQRTPEHLHFPSGKVLELSDISLTSLTQQNQQNIQKAPKMAPQLINPYSLGHIINHPPTDKQANVIFTEFSIDSNFLPQHLNRKYLPYDYLMPKQIKKKDQKNIVFAIIAAKQIKSYQELYVDYNESHIFPIQNIPEWLVEPPENSYVNLIKGEYENPTTFYWNWIEKQAMKEKISLYEKYKATIKRTPGKVIHGEEVIIRQMKTESKIN